MNRFFAPKHKVSCMAVALALAGLAAHLTAEAQTRTNPSTACQANVVNYNPGNGEDIVVPEGYKVERFSKIDLNFPTAVAFIGDRHDFKVLVLESGHGLPSRCNDNEDPANGGKFSATNPFTPDILVLDRDGNKVAGPYAKPTPTGGGFQADGPAIDIAFENRGEGGSEDRDDNGKKGGRLFATDSNQSIRTTGNNTSSRIVVVDISKNSVTPFITGLPTGDHPAEQLEFKDGWNYLSQGSTTNSSVVGHDNGGGANQQEIPCQDIMLSQNTYPSSDGHRSSGYSPHGVARPGAHVAAFESATGPGICSGSIMRAKLNSKQPKSTIEPVSWGYRNPYGIRFAPDDHALKGGLFVTENGEDERGARPTNNSPDRLHLAQQNPDGSPDYHGWPDRFGFLDSTQAVFNPVGGPGDDNPAAVVGKPVQPVLAFPPQPITAPLALEPADVAIVGLDFVPDSFVHGPVKRGAALAGREGDFGFSKANGTPEEGHDVQLINFSKPGEPVQLKLERFAFNKTFEQAFVSRISGINRPVDLKFGPDECAYLVDYGAVRDFGQSDPDSRFCPAKLLDGITPNPAFPGCLTDG